jgi:hypothetical protein
VICGAGNSAPSRLFSRLAPRRNAATAKIGCPIVVLLTFLLARPAPAADAVFSGALQRVTHEAITIRSPDGLLIDARIPTKGNLAAAAITNQFRLADQIQIICKPTSELKNIRRLRSAMPEELAQVAASLFWSAEENLLKHPGPPAGSRHDPAGLEHVRQVNLGRAANMPNFVADETAKRYVAPKNNPTAWRLLDTIESEITFHGGDPTRQHTRINGKPWNKPIIPGIDWNVEFGTELKPLFNPDCPNSFEFEGPQEVRGKQLLAFRFRTPPDGCFGYFGAGDKRYIPARTGRFLVEDPAGAMVQYEEAADEFPKGFPTTSWKKVNTWDYVKSGDTEYLLPVAVDFVQSFTSGELWHIAVEYKNHRHFEASTHLTFR